MGEEVRFPLRRRLVALQASGNDPSSSPNRPGDKKCRPIELVRRRYNKRQPDERSEGNDHPSLQERGEMRNDAEKDAESRGDMSGAAKKTRSSFSMYYSRRRESCAA